MLSGPSRQLLGVDGSSEFRMFLGCVSDGDSTLQTLATLDWNVHYSGTLNSNGKTFKVAKDAGISAAVIYSLSKESPVQTAPIASKAFTYVDSTP
jgi:hypothetical protein